MAAYKEIAPTNQPDAEIDDEDIFTGAQNRRYESRNKLIRCIVFAFATILVSSLTISIYKGAEWRTLSLQKDLPDQHNGQWINCGTTVDDAIARGCKLDIMGNNWVPPLCHDAAFADAAIVGNDSFASRFGTQKFEWFKQPLQEERIDDLEEYLITKARQGEEVTAYTTENWHIAHCMYWFAVGVNAMERLTAGERDVWVPRVVRKPPHARHCSQITGHLFVEESLKENVITPKVFFGYATCVLLA